jgi:nucleoside-diphosphate-sugar epimerase
VDYSNDTLPFTQISDTRFFSAEKPEYVFLAAAKVGGIKLCAAYNKQYGANYLSVMPTNLYGRGIIMIYPLPTCSPR